MKRKRLAPTRLALVRGLVIGDDDLGGATVGSESLTEPALPRIQALGFARLVLVETE